MAACGIPAAMAVRFDRQGSAWNIAVFAVVFPFVHFCVMHCARRTPSQATELLLIEGWAWVYWCQHTTGQSAGNLRQGRGAPAKEGR